MRLLFEELFIEAGIIPRWMERGRKQEKEKIVRNLLRMGMPIKDIAQVTETSVQKIRALAAAASKASLAAIL